MNECEGEDNLKLGKNHPVVSSMQLKEWHTQSLQHFRSFGTIIPGHLSCRNKSKFSHLESAWSIARCYLWLITCSQAILRVRSLALISVLLVEKFCVGYIYCRSWHRLVIQLSSSVCPNGNCCLLSSIHNCRLLYCLYGRPAGCDVWKSFFYYCQFWILHDKLDVSGARWRVFFCCLPSGNI